MNKKSKKDEMTDVYGVRLHIDKFRAGKIYLPIELVKKTGLKTKDRVKCEPKGNKYIITLPRMEKEE